MKNVNVTYLLQTCIFNLFCFYCNLLTSKITNKKPASSIIKIDIHYLVLFDCTHIVYPNQNESKII